jgi:hypothetical protein
VHVTDSGELSWPWEGMLTAIGNMADAASAGGVLHPIVLGNALDLMAVGSALVLIVLATVGPWRLGEQSSYILAFGYASLLLLLVSPIGVVPLHSGPRYMLEILPAFLVLARIGENRRAERLYLLPAIALQGVLLLAYLSNVWVA